MIAGRTIAMTVVAALTACDSTLPPRLDDNDDGLFPPGHSCSAGDECQSGWCISLPAGDACAATCAGECPAGLVCKRADGRDPTSVSICVPPSGSLCQRCATDADCGGFGDLCLPLGGDGLVCGLDCSETDSCPEGYSCESVRGDDGAELPRQCLPNVRTCTCTDLTAGATRPCQRTTPAVGTCFGTELCTPGIGWTGCNAHTPMPELCDAADNDCDGAIDEDLTGEPLTRPCGYGPEPHREECAGVETCTEGVFGTCSRVAPPASETVCDGLDDDCNGLVDDGLLYAVDNCAACGDVCPPGPGGDAATVRSCLTEGDRHYCGPIACRVPYFDVDGLESNGCELADDYTRVGASIILNNTPSAALGLGTVTDADGDHVHLCGRRLPSDTRQHLPTDPPSPNVDYFRFTTYDTAFRVAEFYFCLLAPRLASVDVDAQIEICLTDPNTLTFSSCTTLTKPNNFVTFGQLSSSGTYNDYVVRVRSLVGPYASSYSLMAFDNPDPNWCLLGSAADPCAGTY